MGNLAKCLYSGSWVNFTIQYCRYTNIIEFIKENNIDFLLNMSLNFNELPLMFHGKGESNNLLEYLSNNVDDGDLIVDFIAYFFYNIAKIQSRNGSKLMFHIQHNNDWFKQVVIVSNVAPPIYISVDSTIISCDDTTIYI